MTIPDSNRPFTIYFSHRAGRSAAHAQDLVAAIEGVSRGRIVAHCSAHFPQDDTWSERAGRALDDSNWLVMLFAEKTIEWDWWLWELGYFASHANPRERRMVILHQPGVDVPMPLKPWQSLPATELEARRLLQSIFQDEPLAVRPDLFTQEMKPILNMLIAMIVRCCAPPVTRDEGTSDLLRATFL